MNIKTNNAGFSMIEVLVAVIIVGLITASVWSSLFTSARTRDKIEKKDDFTQMARTVMDRISKDLSLAFIIPQAQGMTGFKGRSNEVTFSTFAHQAMAPNIKECEQTVITYSLSRDKENADLFTLTRRENKRLGNDFGESNGRPLSLLPGISSLKLEYFDGEKFSDNWDHESVETKKKDKIPKAVKVSLDVEDEQGNEHHFYTMVNITLSRIDLKTFDPPAVPSPKPTPGKTPTPKPSPTGGLVPPPATTPL